MAKGRCIEGDEVRFEKEPENPSLERNLQKEETML